MELIVNVSLRTGITRLAEPIGDIQVRDLFAKMPEEVLEELVEKLPDILAEAFRKVGMVDSPEIFE